jgi:hypothetical protein
MRVGFHPAAEVELRASATFYEGRMVGLGSDFVAEVERVHGLIADYPALGAAYDPVHRLVLFVSMRLTQFSRLPGKRASPIVSVCHICIQCIRDEVEPRIRPDEECRQRPEARGISGGR